MKRRSDYRPPAFLIPAIELEFDLDPHATRVTATLHFQRAAANPEPLVLDGENQQLLSVALNGTLLAPERYQLSDKQLLIDDVGETGTLTIVSQIAPARNTALEGLYVSSNVFCTQCEAEGFRRITYFPDRPDVLSRFTVTLRAQRTAVPVLLSNGNLIGQGELPDGRHFARWQDPFPKPCYLFALVAGDLALLPDEFTTMSGRRVRLEIYSTPANIPRCAWAMRSLKQAMRWDEQRYRREYDLDRFMIFCADDFNMGAMENKGLNIFNSALVLADPKTATDDDYHAIESVIGHEYFHNWTGDRVTCRDWFQLSLKEGLTVFRDQQFSSDMGSPANERIQMVEFLRKRQFPEDAGPTAHPVRPDEYQAINNFYTTTVYEKGAEVIRMQHTLLGEEAFQRGMDLYFQRHDGQAVTCDDFVAAMQAASGIDLTQFKRWYAQAGTPEVRAQWRQEADNTFVLTLAQSTPPTPGQPHKEALVIPVDTALLAADGSFVPLRWADGSDDAAPTRRVLVLNQAQQSFSFRASGDNLVPSLLRGGSAPVRLIADYDPEELERIARYETDPVARWDAMQRAFIGALDNLATRKKPLSPTLIELVADLLKDEKIDPMLRALALNLPDLAALADIFTPFAVDAFVAARQQIEQQLSLALQADWCGIYEKQRAAAQRSAYQPNAEQSAQRKLAAHALRFACIGKDECALKLAYTCGTEADNMTDAIAALTALRDIDHPLRDELYARFEQRWRDNPLVLDKWFAQEATSQLDNSIARVERLLQHPGFSLRNPNRVRAVLGSFALRNFAGFHAADGSGYRFVAHWVRELDRLNPHSAAMLVNAFRVCRKLAAPHGDLAMAVLRELREGKHSEEVSELLAKLTA